MPLKPVEFLADSLDQLRGFPLAVRRDAGFQLDRVEHGLEPDDWRPMTAIGSGVKEIRIRDVSGAYRVIYLAKLADAVYVLHCFQKKTQETSQQDMDIAKQRFKDLMRKQP